MSRFFRRIVPHFNIARSASTKIDLNNLVASMNSFKSKKGAAPKKKYASSNLSLQVMGSGAHGTPASLYVVSDQTRYLFNCGEGTQRLAHEHKMKLSKLEHIFITGSSWKNFGGLPGLCMTVRDAGVTDLTIHGPAKVDEIFHASKRFVTLGDLNVKLAAVIKPFEDSVMKVNYVLIEGENSSDTDKLADESSGDDENPIKEKRICVRSVDSNKSLCFICTLHPRKGTLLLDQCEKFKVPLGPLLGKLKAGEDIILQDGTVVRSQDVTSPDDPGSVFIVVECPDKSYLTSLLDHQELKKHQVSDSSSKSDLVKFVIHFTPPEVMCLPEYQKWIKLFSPSTTHVALNSDNYCQGTTAVHRLQHKLHLLHQDIFPLMKERPQIASAVSNVVQGNTLVKCNVQPKPGIDLSSRLLIDPQLYVEECLVEAGFEEELKSLSRKLQIADVKGAVYPRVTFLGTGSCIPNKTRNTSGILVETSKDSCFLMDCGEATAGQLIRLFGLPGANDILRKLKGIFVSHLHADHHIGLVGVILARKKAFELRDVVPSKLILLLPYHVVSFVSEYSSTFENIADQVEVFQLTEGVDYSEFNRAIGLKETTTCLVRHCSHAYGILCEHETGWKIVYSGDTEPCDKLTEMGYGCDLLIHEATMEDGLEDEARKKRHSTTSEAIQVGQKMAAKFTLLTHFSQRYAKIPIFNEKFSESVGIAFDNMQVSLSQLHLLPVMMPAMKIMFSKYHEEMETKMIKIQQRKEKREQILQKIEKKKLATAFTK
ncbi:ribonuclease Z, mitochondrial-like [Cloeon dipterum]|uniref:ribonuclease Z, mitochondrial-like n=1 Tax=Cloeon dipterum TaxID=197152 RepID=UPI00321FF30B